MVVALVLLPVLAGLVLAGAGARVPIGRRRAGLGGAAVLALLAGLVLAVLAAVGNASTTYAVSDALTLRLEVTGAATVMAPLVAAIATVVVAAAAVHEPEQGLGRLLGWLTAFVGAMQLLVVAADLLTLLIGFELVAATSWLLIGHDREDPDAAAGAAHAFNATRAGSLGLFVAAGAALADVGSLAYVDLVDLSGGWRHAVVGGVLLAAVAKSAQGPFAPWLRSAMAGPTPVSALLHSSTMVAAGVYALVRLQPALDQVGWFAPVTIAIGLVTALGGGVVALLQPHGKRLLAASTSAQYGLMLVAVGTGAPVAAMLHLVAHAVLKAQLFLSVGVAMHATGSGQLGRMRLGSALPVTAALTAVGAASLAGLPPLGAAFSKEQVVAAAGHLSPGLAVAVIAAGALSAAYATRLQLLAFGRQPGSPPRDLAARPGRVELGALLVLGLAAVALSAWWWPPVAEHTAGLLGGAPVSGPLWELGASLVAVLVAGYAVLRLDGQGGLGRLGTTGPAAAAADWLGLPTAIRRVVVDPTLALARGLSRLDDRVVDRGVAGAGAGAAALADRARRVDDAGLDGLVRASAAATSGLARGATRGLERGVDATVAGVAWVSQRAGGDARRLHTGLVHHQLVIIVVGAALVVVAAVLGR